MIFKNASEKIKNFIEAVDIKTECFARPNLVPSISRRRLWGRATAESRSSKSLLSSSTFWWRSLLLRRVNLQKKVFSFLFNGYWRDRGLYQELAHLSLPTLAQVEPMAKGALHCSIFLGGNINRIFYWHLQFCTLRKRFDFVFTSI